MPQYTEAEEGIWFWHGGRGDNYITRSFRFVGLTNHNYGHRINQYDMIRACDRQIGEVLRET